MQRTKEFHEAVASNERSLPPTKRPRVKFGANRTPPPTSATSKNGVPPAPPAEDNWTKQAQQVATNLRSFSSFLQSIRRAYLDLGSSSSHHASQPRAPLDPSKGLAAWEGVRWLNDRERDEIDFGVKVALRRSVDRVRELEASEKLRVANESRVNPNHGLSRMLRLPVPPSKSSASDQLANHRTLITLYLNTLLAQVSQAQRDQQEARVARQLERTATLGGLGGGGALGMDQLGKSNAEKAKSDYVAGKGGKGKEKEVVGVGEVPSIYRPAPIKPSADGEDPEGDELDQLLTADQIQQFEAEESLLLQSTKDDLASLKLAESSLLEIASLQSQLAMHLSQQSELTDKLWEEAVAVTGKVEEGNVQLKKARERNRESRVWLLILLMMASGTLLFLDYYS
ncbi:SNARE protein syntaxin 18/UFE1 [Pseudohyphozyma bogoriensis]|nr:SNARE protein syntaxin 18/UFE1 [Pseudohyphozyma bogoriensis]